MRDLRCLQQPTEAIQTLAAQYTLRAQTGAQQDTCLEPGKCTASCPWAALSTARHETMQLHTCHARAQDTSTSNLKSNSQCNRIGFAANTHALHTRPVHMLVPRLMQARKRQIALASRRKHIHDAFLIRQGRQDGEWFLSQLSETLAQIDGSMWPGRCCTLLSQGLQA